jgi:hypothetical protein
MREIGPVLPLGGVTKIFTLGRYLTNPQWQDWAQMIRQRRNVSVLLGPQDDPNDGNAHLPHIAPGAA